MKERFKTPNAVFVILFRGNKDNLEILLQKRKNTGFMDGYWDVAASGHVEEGESTTEAAAREAREELGIEIAKNDIKFAGFYYNNFGSVTYCHTYFDVRNYSGIPRVNEPNKCSEIKWFYIKDLPKDMIDERKTSVMNYLKGIYFGEFGWDD